MLGQEKIVKYDLYCKKCQHYAEKGKDGLENEKCEDCLATPGNVDSHKPVNYKEVK